MRNPKGEAAKALLRWGGSARRRSDSAHIPMESTPPVFSNLEVRWGFPSGPIGLPEIPKLLGCSCAIPMGLPWMRGIGLHPNCSPARLCELCEGKWETLVDLRCWTFLVPNICASHSPLGNLTPQIQFEGACTCASLASKEVRDSLSID